MPVKSCEVCASPYTQKRRDQRYCSTACHSQRRSRVATSRSCEVCQTTYSPTYGQQRTCSRTCGAQIKQRPARSKLKWTPCPECSSWMSRPRDICSGACRDERAQRRLREQWYREKRLRRRAIACLHCQATYCWAGDGRGWPRYCSDVCKLEYRRARKKTDIGKNDRQRARHFGVQYEPIDRQKVYERDRWRCGLCGKRVRQDHKSPHPLSPSLDHVIPLSRGGDHLYANVQCSHFQCNWMKGNGGSQQLSLVG